jgi:hypothetical protein
VIFYVIIFNPFTLSSQSLVHLWYKCCVVDPNFRTKSTQMYFIIIVASMELIAIYLCLIGLYCIKTCVKWTH